MSVYLFPDQNIPVYSVEESTPTGGGGGGGGVKLNIVGSKLQNTASNEDF